MALNSLSCLVLLFFLAVSAKAEALSLSEVGTLIRAGKLEDAYTLLSSRFDEKEVKDSTPYHYALGRLSLDLGFFDKAADHFSKANGQDSLFQNWSNYYLGMIARQQNEGKKAKGKLMSLAGGKQPTRLRIDARLELALTAVQSKNWKEARIHFSQLERNFRGSSKYPEILWHLIGVEKNSGRMWNACRWAAKLYASYPSYETIAHWGVDLQNNTYEDKKLGCIASVNDQKRRIQRLQWSGQSQRARAEIDLLRARASGSTKVHVDLLFANFLVREGYVDEALKVLVKLYPTEKKSITYLNMLATAALAAGEYHAAVAAYEQAYQSNPRARSARQALFQAAFTSYRFRDYDGADERFRRFQKKYPTSGLTRDAAWHIAWMKYLRHDYKGANGEFKRILAQKKRNKRYWRSFPQDRIEYWMAMSQLRMGQVANASAIFEKMNRDKSREYYAILAGYRLEEIQNKGLRMPSQSAAVEEPAPAEESENLAEKSEDDDIVTEEEESEENISALSEDSEDAEKVEVEEGDGETMISEMDLKSPTLALHFERAKSFVQMGFDEAARWELYEIERKTRKEDQLKALMYHYEQIGSYHRSSYIGQVYFERQRNRYGLDGVRYLWEYTYPRAYKDSVEKYSKDFSIPSQLTWSIMRAESQFRFDAVSPVGARGLMQLMPNTAQQVAQMVGRKLDTMSALETPEVNIQLGSRYLHRLMKKFEESVPLVAAAYNAGPHRVDSWLDSFAHLEMDEFIDHIPFVETRNYVKKVVRNYRIYSELYGKQKPRMPWLIESVSIRPKTNDFTRESWEM